MAFPRPHAAHWPLLGHSWATLGLLLDCRRQYPRQCPWDAMATPQMPMINPRYTPDTSWIHYGHTHIYTLDTFRTHPWYTLDTLRPLTLTPEEAWWHPAAP
jgi:hypothetical protein